MKPTSADVDWCYRTFLNRPPESAASIEGWLATDDWRGLVSGFLASVEYRDRMGSDARARYSEIVAAKCHERAATAASTERGRSPGNAHEAIRRHFT